MLLSDRQIAMRVLSDRMIEPFEPSLVRHVECDDDRLMKVISYGPSSYGYDIRLSPKEFKIFRHIPGEVVDPKDFNPEFLEEAKLHADWRGQYFILPAHTYGLGVALEYLNVPADITVLFIGKSTYARCGVIANLTPAEAGWHGHLTLEISNGSDSDCMIYANEGIVQALFFQGEPCNVSYADRAGKYQGQGEQITLARA